MSVPMAFLKAGKSFSLKKHVEHTPKLHRGANME
jgi:hypothetical protein